MELTRRRMLATGLAALPLRAQKPPLIETHIHLFDPARVPYAANAPYQPKPQTLESYIAFAAGAGIDHAIIVHPEPYQDDHRYLSYCLAHEPTPGFFKATCLYDPIDPRSPAWMEALVKKNPGRIVALRIHETHALGTPSLTSGPIKDRDMHSPQMLATWKAAHSLGLAIQMHFLPHYAPQIGELGAKFPRMPILLDHLARAGQGTPADFEEVLKLAKLPRVYMKYSGVEYSSKQPFPYLDVKPMIRRIYDAFGPERILWGGLGYTRAEFAKQEQLFASMFDFASQPDRGKIRGLNAAKLFQW